MTTVIYDNHFDTIPIHLRIRGNSFEKGGAENFDTGSHRFVYPIINVCKETKAFIEKRYLETLPQFVFDIRERKSPIKISRRPPNSIYFNPKIYSSANYLTMNNEVGFGDLDLKIEQVHIDPDLFSRKGAEDFFGEDLPSKFFYFGRGNNNGQPLTELLTRHGKGLQLLGLFEFYGQNTEERERGGIYNAVTNALEKADFSPENLAIDPPILEKVPDLGGICRRIIELPGYPASRTGEGIVLSEEPKLYEYPKTLVIAMSHYSAVMTYDRKPIEEMISLLEQEFQPRGYPRTMLSAVPPEY